CPILRASPRTGGCMTPRSLLSVLVVCLVAAPAAAQDRRAFVEGIGGIRLSSAPGTAASVGGMVGGNLTPYMEAIGEVGRMSDVMPPTAATAIALTPATFRVSSFYGLGGIRLTTTSVGHVRAYAETLGGITRLSNTFGGVGSPALDAITNTALRFVDTTDPMAAVGAGVIFQAGSFVANVGY